MKESISYSFLLNIIILFIFVCASIIAGIFSYYKAFRANTIIINEIEKYEGYNCNSMSKIASKLKTISYNLPFDVKCKDGEDNCATDEFNNYKVYSYNMGNIDVSYELKENGVNGPSIQCNSKNKCQTVDTYQYGVYTYMYTDLPVVSGLLRIPVYSKTKPLHDYRNLAVDKTTDEGGNDTYIFYDLDSFPDIFLVADQSLKDIASDYANHIFYDNYDSANDTNGMYMSDFGHGIKRVKNYKGVNLRDAFVYNDASLENSESLITTMKKKCGIVPDWTMF